MNSKSKNFVHREPGILREDCDCQHPLGGKVIFKSSYSNFGPMDVTFEQGSLLYTFNQPIGSVTIDTTCLTCPDVLIRFVGLLNVIPAAIASSTLIFTLYKICNGMKKRQLTTFTYYVSDVTGGVANSHPLVFEFPTDNNCENCCAYVLELTSISNLDFATVTYSINGTLSALAIGETI